MNFNNAVFEAAYGTAEQLPASDLPEICFSGRSNVGKSSLINRVLGRKALARVSSTPGKTVTVNFYRADNVRLVDLPGYGYAKVNFAEKTRWSELMEHYFNSNRDIRLVMQLIDMRRPATEFDISMLEFMRNAGIAYALVLTKSDKLNKTDYTRRLESIRQELGTLADGVDIIPFSALKGTGTEEVREAAEKAYGKN